MKGLKKFFVIVLIGLPCTIWAKKTAHQETLENKKQSVKSHKDVPRNRLAELPNGPKAETSSYYISSSKTLLELTERVNDLARTSNAMESFLHTPEAGMMIIAQKKKILKQLQQKLDEVIKWVGADRVDIIGQLSLRHPSSNLNGRSATGLIILVQLLNFNPSNEQEQKKRMLLLKTLLLNGIKINNQTMLMSNEILDMTPLMRAAFWGNAEAGRLLLGSISNADEKRRLVNIVDSERKSALIYVFESPFSLTEGHIAILKEMLKANPSLSNVYEALVRLEPMVHSRAQNLPARARTPQQIQQVRQLTILKALEKMFKEYLRNQTEQQSRLKWWKK